MDRTQSLKFFIKKELSGWKYPEIFGLLLVIGIILYNYFCLNDSIIAVTSALCGILYTVIAGKGKISCYIFGLAGSGFYGYLAFVNALYGNLALYLLYYIPMQILGIFKWKNHLKKETLEIYKTKLNIKERVSLSLISILLCVAGYYILCLINDSHPAIDGVTTMLSLVGMYLTVRRAIEQWIVWMIVNLFSAIVWIKIISSGTHVYSTALMWLIYFILAFYFYKEWKKEI